MHIKEDKQNVHLEEIHHTLIKDGNSVNEKEKTEYI